MVVQDILGAMIAPLPAAKLERKNLILVTHPGAQDWRDFEAIGNEIVRMAPDIAVYVVSPLDVADTIPYQEWGRRSLIVSFGPLGKFGPLRGLVFQNAFLSKERECSLFAAAGVRTPFTSAFRIGVPFDGRGHRPLVVAKPTKVGSMSYGNNVCLMRKERVQQVIPSRFPPELICDDAPILVQDFIDTGENPEHFRVLVLLGEPLFCFKAIATSRRPRLDASDVELEAGQVATNSDARRIEFVTDREVIEFAKRASRAIWWIPLLGLDIVREIATGALYALEANCGGNTWAFSSQIAERTRELVGGAEPFKNQLGAWKAAARALIKATRSRAE